jgi:hypothetical protein
MMPNPVNQLWRSTARKEFSWSNSPVGAFTPPPPPVDVPVEYSDGVDVLYSDSSAVNYV